MAAPDLTVFRGWIEPGRYVWSPFAIKLEARLRFSGVKYATDAGSRSSNPKGKIPYIECTSPANPATKVQLNDTTLIIKQLTEWGMISDLNAQVSPALSAHDLALRSLLEDKLYFYHMYERWILNYYTMRDYALVAIPYPLRVLVGLLVSRTTTATLHGQGTGRFSAEEIAAFRLDIWEAINSLLTESRSRAGLEAGGLAPFWLLGGEQPTEADATLYGFIVSVLICTAAPDSGKVVREFSAVLEYATRIHDRFFPEYDKWDE